MRTQSMTQGMRYLIELFTDLFHAGFDSDGYDVVHAINGIVTEEMRWSV